MNCSKIFEMLKEQRGGEEMGKTIILLFLVLTRLLYSLLQRGLINEKNLIWIVKGE